MKMPSEISTDFEGAWEEYIGLPQMKGLDQKLTYEGFRILLQQADIKCPTRMDFSDFFTVNKRYGAFQRLVTTKHLNFQLQPVSHKFEIVLNEDKLANILNGFTVHGRVKLKPLRFDLRYLLERMVSLGVFKQLPEVLGKATKTPVKTGEETRNYYAAKKEKFASSMQALRRTDFAVVHRDAQTVLGLARIKGDFLVLDYRLDFTFQSPLYPNVEKQLIAIWRRATIGDFR